MKKIKKRSVEGYFFSNLLSLFCKFEKDFDGEYWAETQIAKKKYKRDGKIPKYTKVRITMEEIK